jgi:hypothetical protein
MDVGIDRSASHAEVFMAPRHRIFGCGAVLLSALLAGCSAPRAGQPDPQPEDEHAFHTTQEHYGRAGAIPEREPTTKDQAAPAQRN